MALDRAISPRVTYAGLALLGFAGLAVLYAAIPGTLAATPYARSWV